MNIIKVNRVASQARSLARLCDELKEVARKDSGVWVTGCKESSALRRASMELTRALAEMRKP